MAKLHVNPEITIGFLDLPRELRNYIYWLIVDPSDKGKPGNTKILCLSKQVYEEAIVYLKAYVPVFRLGIERYRSLFRNSKANGKPMLYGSTTLSSGCYTYQRLTELELSRFTSIQLLLDSIHGRYRHRVAEKVVADIREITQAVRKSTHLQTIAIYISEGWAVNMSGHDELMEACKQLLRVCGNKGIALVLQYHQGEEDCEEQDKAEHDEGIDYPSSAGTSPSPFADTLAVYLQATAAAVNVSMTVHRPGKEPYEDLDSIRNYDNYTLLYRPQGCKSHPIRFYHLTTLDKPYKLIPEYRQCLTIFATGGDLSLHLKAHPDHMMHFRRKRWNPTSPFGINQGGRVCRTCGYSCNALYRLEAHLERLGHKRHGIVPRYSEDNAAWDRKWSLSRVRDV